MTPSQQNKPSAHSFISYIRVSTERQGRSGLGLEAQQEIVRSFLSANEGDLLDEYIEVESGKKSDRPELAKAIEECRRRKAVLLIAKLDRLARNVHFISGLMESRVEFVAADNPHANRLMIHLLAAFAEHEREMISKRTKEALAAAKARGVALGRNGTTLGQRNRARAVSYSNQIRGTVKQICNEGHQTLTAIADELNERNIPTPMGFRWHPTSVKRLLSRLNAA